MMNLNETGKLARLVAASIGSASPKISNREETLQSNLDQVRLSATICHFFALLVLVLSHEAQEGAVT